MTTPMMSVYRLRFISDPKRTLLVHWDIKHAEPWGGPYVETSLAWLQNLKYEDVLVNLNDLSAAEPMVIQYEDGQWIEAPGSNDIPPPPPQD